MFFPGDAMPIIVGLHLKALRLLQACWLAKMLLRHGEMDIVRKIIGFLLSVPKNFDGLDDSGSLRDNRQWPATNNWL